MGLIESGTSVTIGGIEAWSESTRESVGADGASATAKVRTRWSDRWPLIEALAGGIDADGVNVTVRPPAAYPDAPALMKLYGIDIEGEGVLSAGTDWLPAYEWAVLSLTYKNVTPQFGEFEDTGSVEVDLGASVLTLPTYTRVLKYVGSGASVPTDVAPAIVMPTVNFSIERRNLPKLNLPALLPFAGAINSVPFQGAEGGKVRYLGARSFKRIGVSANPNWTITHQFEYRPIPWDVFARQTGSATFEWTRVTFANAANDPLYPILDLNQIFA